jgi:hypothetical protein
MSDTARDRAAALEELSALAYATEMDQLTADDISALTALFRVIAARGAASRDAVLDQDKNSNLKPIAPVLTLHRGGVR